MKKKLIWVLAGVAVLAVVLFLGGRGFLLAKVRQAIGVQADSLRKQGFTVTYDSLSASVWQNEVHFATLRIRYPASVSCKDTTGFVQADRVSIEGIEIFPLVFHRLLVINSIRVTAPRILSVPQTAMPAKKHASKKPAVNGVTVRNLRLSSVEFSSVDSGTCRVGTIARFSLQASDVALANPGTDDFSAMVGMAAISDAEVRFPAKFYTITVPRITLDGDGHRLDIDSVHVKPDYDKVTFMQKTGFQTDRIACTISAIQVSGLDLPVHNKPEIHAQHIALRFDADIYRDKRYPGRNDLKQLPGETLHAIGIPLQIDSITVHDSNIVYEEFQTSGDRPGRISFNDLQATIRNISNHSPADMTMSASTKFMNAGKLRAAFTFPSDPNKPYSVRGEMGAFSLSAVNPMLIPAAHAEIKKGMLRDMRFHFVYNEFRSDGELTMDYSDLDVASLQKNSNNKTENKVVTMILNAFIIKKNMDRGKSTGTILFFYDHKHSVFNYWWKSLLSGIKSLYNLDKIQDTSHSKKGK